MRSFFSHGLPPLLRTILVVSAGLCLACSQRSPEEDLVDQAGTAISWIASLRMTGEQWSANSVPASFVASTVKAARAELEQEAKDAAKSKAPPALRDPFHQIVLSAEAAGEALGRAVEAGDRPGVAREVGRLAALQKGLEALRGQQEGRAP